jgi:hypothetical protein
MQFTASRPDIVRSVRHRWLLNYWQRLRGRQPVPAWSALDPDELSRMVDNMQFCDIVDDGGRMRFVVRFCGARIVQAYGECNDEYFDEKLPPLLRDQVIAIYRHTAQTRKPVYTVCTVPDRDGKPVDFERLLLPFARDSINVDRVLAMLEWVSIEGGYESRQLLRSQAQTPVYSVCAAIEGLATGPATS